MPKYPTAIRLLSSSSAKINIPNELQPQDPHLRRTSAFAPCVHGPNLRPCPPESLARRRPRPRVPAQLPTARQPAESRSREAAASDISLPASPSSSSRCPPRPARVQRTRLRPLPPPIEGRSAPYPRPQTERSPPLRPGLRQSLPPLPRRIPASANSGAPRPGAWDRVPKAAGGQLGLRLGAPISRQPQELRIWGLRVEACGRNKERILRHVPEGLVPPLNDCMTVSK